MRVIVLADDLTGALDTGVQFSQRGLRTVVLPFADEAAPPRRDGGGTGAEVLIVNTGTRDAAPDRARQVVREWVDRLARREPQWWYKKIDSLLRGPWRAELAAVQERLGCGALVCPAYPAQGRVVRGGAVLLADGTRVGDLAPPARGLTADAATHTELDGVVRAALEAGIPLLCGSAGLAAALARYLVPDPPVPSPLPLGPHRVLVVVGSRTPLARRQAAALRPAEDAGASVRLLLAPPGEGPEDTAHAAELARASARLHREQQFGALLLTGGETAAAVLRELRALSVEPRHELLPGCPAAVVRGGSADGALLITKSGSFGADFALLRIVEWLKGERL